MEFLAEAGDVLASSLDYETTLRNVARLAVPSLGDWCVVYIADEDGSIRRLALEPGDDDGFADTVQGRFRLNPGAATGVPAVIREGRPIFMPEATAEALSTDVAEPKALERLIEATMTIRSWICVPLRARGRTLGAISLVATAPSRRYDELDLALANDLAARAAIAIDNARLFADATAAIEREREARRAVERTGALAAALQEVTTGLARALTAQEVGRVIVDRAASALRAHTGALLLRSDDGRWLEFVASHGHSDAVVRRWARFPLDDRTPAGLAILERRPVLIRSLEDRNERFPMLEREVTECQAWSAIPLRAADETMGALVLGFTAGQSFDADDERFLLTLGEQCAQALERARLYEAERIARGEAEVAVERLSFLARAGDLLGASLDFKRTLERLAGLVVPELADWCAIHVGGEDGAIHEVAVVAHADEHKMNVLRQLQDEYPPRPDAAAGVGAVVRTGAAELYQRVGDETLRAVARDERHLELLRSVGFTSAMCVPMLWRGRTLGVLTLVSTSPSRLYDAASLTFAEELAERAAQAVDNARLFYEAEKTGRRLNSLLEGVEAAVWEADATLGHVTFISKRVEDLYGYPPRSWLEDPAFWLRTVHPDDRDRVATIRRRAARESSDYDVEYRILTRQGAVKWLRDVVHVSPGSDGVIRLYGVTVDITREKHAERRQRVQYEVARAAAEETSFECAGTRALETVCRAFDLPAGELWLEEGDGHRLAARWTSYPELEGVLAAGDGPSREVAAAVSARQAAIVDIGPGETGQFETASLRRAAFAPVRADKAALGFMAVYGESVPDDLATTLAGVSHQLAQVALRFRAETELRLKTALLESQTEATLDGILVVAHDGSIISFNRRFVEMWSIPDEVLRSRSDEAAIASVMDQLVDPQAFADKIEYLYRHPHQRSRDEIVLKDGRIFDRWSTPLTGDDGTHYGRAWYCRDVTEQKRIERRLAESKDRAAFLAEVSTAAASSTDFRTTLAEVARLCAETLADWCVVDVVRPDDAVERVAIAHRDPERQALVLTVDALRQYGQNASTPYGVQRVLRSGQWEIVPAIQDDWLIEEARGDERYLELLRSMGLRSAICVPMRARGRVNGVITLVTSESSGRTLGPAELALAEEVAYRAGSAFETARLYEEHRYISVTLQHSLIPPSLPEIDSLDLAARYHPAGEGLEVGGDFYDVFGTGRGDWAIIVGDVCGKGADAAATTALARHTLRAAAMRARRPSKVLHTLNEAMLRSSQRFCTVSYVRVRERAGSVRITACAGGHPLPLVLRADGRVVRLGRAGTLLGCFPDVSLHDVTADLTPGDLVVLYTDGVTEARASDGAQFGEERLASLVGRCRGFDADECAEAILTDVLEFQGGRARDDIAVVVAKVR